MKTERYVVDGKEYDLIVDGTGLGGKVTPTFEGSSLGVTYSVSVEVALDSKPYLGNALEFLLNIVKDDLDKGIVKAPMGWQ